MQIALVYNVKGEKSRLNSLNENINTASHSNNKTTGFQQSETSSKSLHDPDIYAEWDDEDTILAVKDALEEKHTVRLLEADEECYLKLKNNRPEMIFNIAEGLYGTSREAIMPGIYEMMQIPYTGSDPLTLAICLNKARTKEILSYYNIPNPTFTVIYSIENDGYNRLNFPLIVKPLHEGSSKGIMNSSFVENQSQLVTEIERISSCYNQPALVEEFLPGREFTVALLGNGNNVQALPIVEFDLNLLPEGSNKIYSYEAKWIWDTVENPLHGIHICPAKIDSNLKEKIETVAKSAFHALNCKDWCRIDIRLDNQGIPKIVELNPLPGIIPDPEAHSCFPSAAWASGMSYNQLINKVMDTAIERYKLKSK